MRLAAFAFVPFLLLSGCYAEVHGDPPQKACSGAEGPARSHIVGTEASWAGRLFTATEDGVKLWVDGGEADMPEDQWWGANANAWAVVAMTPGKAPEVVEARAGLIQYDDSRTTIRVGPAGQTFPAERGMIGAHEIIGPIALDKGETLMVVGTADAPTSALALQLRWEGCGETGEIVWGVGSGFVAGWGELEGPFVASNVGAGAIAYESRLERVTETGIVLAQPPAGGDPTGRNVAKVTTSEGQTSLDTLRFFAHAGGKVAYDVTHVGEAGDEPLVAFLPLAFL